MTTDIITAKSKDELVAKLAALGRGWRLVGGHQVHEVAAGPYITSEPFTQWSQTVEKVEGA